MRHLGSLIAGLFMTPAVWLLLAIGQPRATSVFTRWVDHNAYDTRDLITPVIYLIAAGLVFGLVASLRLSPAGPILAGLLYTAVYVVMFIDPLWGLDHIPSRLDLLVIDGEPQIPVVNGTLALIACCLFVAAASRQRWLRWPNQPAQETEQALPDGEVLSPAPTWSPSLAALPAGTSVETAQPVIRVLSGTPDEPTAPAADTVPATVSLAEALPAEQFSSVPDTMTAAGTSVDTSTPAESELPPLPRRHEAATPSPWAKPPSATGM